MSAARWMPTTSTAGIQMKKGGPEGPPVHIQHHLEKRSYMAALRASAIQPSKVSWWALIHSSA